MRADAADDAGLTAKEKAQIKKKQKERECELKDCKHFKPSERDVEELQKAE